MLPDMLLSTEFVLLTIHQKDAELLELHNLVCILRIACTLRSARSRN